MAGAHQEQALQGDRVSYSLAGWLEEEKDRPGNQALVIVWP